MERIPFGMAQLDVEGGYFPGGGESSDLAESLTHHDGWDDWSEAEEPELTRERLDASLFAAMLHP